MLTLSSLEALQVVVMTTCDASRDDKVGIMTIRGFACTLLHTTNKWHLTEPILGLRPANERRRYKVTPSLIGWAHT